MDGLMVPSLFDLCYYIGDWAIKYPDKTKITPVI